MTSVWSVEEKDSLVIIISHHVIFSLIPFFITMFSFRGQWEVEYVFLACSSNCLFFFLIKERKTERKTGRKVRKIEVAEAESHTCGEQRLVEAGVA